MTRENPLDRLDRMEATVEAAAKALGCNLPWSKDHEHGACVLDGIESLTKSLADEHSVNAAYKAEVAPRLEAEIAARIAAERRLNNVMDIVWEWRGSHQTNSLKLCDKIMDSIDSLKKDTNRNDSAAERRAKALEEALGGISKDMLAVHLDKHPWPDMPADMMTRDDWREVGAVVCGYLAERAKRVDALAPAAAPGEVRTEGSGT